MIAGSSDRIASPSARDHETRVWDRTAGPVIALATHLSGGEIASPPTSPGALDPLVTSVESGLVTLGVLFVVCTPLA